MMPTRLPRTVVIALLGATCLIPFSSVGQATPPNPPSQSLVPKPIAAKPTDKVGDKAAAPDKVGAEDKAADDKAGQSEKGGQSEKAMASDKAFFDAKLAGLKAGLELTPAQVPLWPPVESAIRDLAKVGFEIHHSSEPAPTDPREQLKRASQRLTNSGKAIGALTDATGPLLAALDADQKDRLATLLDRLPPHRILRKAFDLPDAQADARGMDDRGMGEHDMGERGMGGRMDRAERWHHDGGGERRGDRAYGDREHGDRDLGDRDSGDRDSGDRDSGDRASGDHHGPGDRDAMRNHDRMRGPEDRREHEGMRGPDSMGEGEGMRRHEDKAEWEGMHERDGMRDHDGMRDCGGMGDHERMGDRRGMDDKSMMEDD